VLSKEDTADRHEFATENGTHAGNHQRDTEKGNCRELTLSVGKVGIVESKDN
jgi:hypothetical protein